MVTIELDMKDSRKIHKLEKILRSVFGLTNKEVECFMKLRGFGSDGTCVQNLTIETKTDRSVEQKKLNKLFRLGLIYRDQLTLGQFRSRCSQINREDLAPSTKKGYLYVYRAISDAELFKKIQIITNQWLDSLKNDFLLID